MYFDQLSSTHYTSSVYFWARWHNVLDVRYIIIIIIQLVQQYTFCLLCIYYVNCWFNINIYFMQPLLHLSFQTQWRLLNFH